MSQLRNLLSSYSPSVRTITQFCVQCCRGGLCRERAKLIVKNVAWSCSATEEEVARWVIEQGIDLTSLLVDLISWYRDYKELQEEGMVRE
jgi:hypothetical protein